MEQGLMSSLRQQIELLQRHIKVLDVIVNSEKPLGILKLSKLTTFPPHQVRYSLRELEQAKMIGPSTKGAFLPSEGKGAIINLEKDIGEIKNAIESLNNDIKEVQGKLK